MVASGPMPRSTDECEISRSCQRATFSIAGTTDERTRRARPVRFSVSTGLRLWGMADEPFWPSEKILFGFEHFGALQVADLGGDALDGRGDDAESREVCGMAIARDDLGRNRLDGEAELLAATMVPRCADRCWRKCRRRLRWRTWRNFLFRGRFEAFAVARHFGVEAGELDAERGGFGVDAVAAADGGRELVFEARASSSAARTRSTPLSKMSRGAAGAARRGRCRARQTRSCRDGGSGLHRQRVRQPR